MQISANDLRVADYSIEGKEPPKNMKTLDIQGLSMELVMGVGPMNLVITNDALYQLSYTSTFFATH